MRVMFSYGLAFLILLGAGAWLATGTFVVGGNGPGNGEKPIISVIEGQEHGPIATTLAERSRPSIAASSPKTSPGNRSR